MKMACPKCRKTFQTSATSAGVTVRCPGCATHLRIPKTVDTIPSGKPWEHAAPWSPQAAESFGAGVQAALQTKVGA